MRVCVCVCHAILEIWQASIGESGGVHARLFFAVTSEPQQPQLLRALTMAQTRAKQFVVLVEEKNVRQGCSATRLVCNAHLCLMLIWWTSMLIRLFSACVERCLLSLTMQLGRKQQVTPERGVLAAPVACILSAVFHSAKSPALPSFNHISDLLPLCRGG